MSWLPSSTSSSRRPLSNLNNNSDQSNANNQSSLSSSQSQNRQIDGIAPTFQKKPSILQEDDGRRLIFECRILADPQPIVKWHHNGQPLPSAPRYKVSNNNLSNYFFVLFFNFLLNLKLALFFACFFLFVLGGRFLIG